MESGQKRASMGGLVCSICLLGINLSKKTHCFPAVAATERKGCGGDWQ